MKILHWNVNGIRAILKKDNIIDNTKKKINTLENFIYKEDADIVCFNETKICEEKMNELGIILKKYPYQYYTHCQTRKGYSGVSIYSKIKPIQQLNDFEDNEGRLICLEYKNYYLVATYVPNSGSTLQRLSYRVNKWDKQFKQYISKLLKSKEVIIVGDMNVANNDIDIFKPEAHHKSAGFTDEERDSFKTFLNETKMIDTFRYLHPNVQKYTYYNYRTKARLYNSGWRIDYCLVSNKLKNKIKNSKILDNIWGSDHLPILLEL